MRSSPVSVRGVFLILICCLVFPAAVRAQDQELSRLQKRFLTGLTEELEKAERYLDKAKPEQALKFHDRAVEQLESLGNEPIPELLQQSLDPLITRLQGVRAGLEVASMSPAEIPALGGKGDSDFSKVAAVLVARCGNCHVRQSRGEFSMATYKALMDSGHVKAKDPVGSRLVQVIETGEMPPGGNRLSDEEAKLISKWVESGATGSADQNAGLASVGGSAAGPAEPPVMTQAAAPSGKETVSFSRDVAPVLAANCRGCHVEANRPRGNLDLTSLMALLRGGDGGPALTAGRGKDSLLVKKLKGMGDGQRMPQGAAPLSGDLIAKIEKWIDEGATFDGDDPAMSVSTLAAVSQVAGLDHEQLAAQRREGAIKTWLSAFPGEQPHVEENGDFILVTNLAEPQRVQAVALIAETLGALRTELEIPEGQPLVNGKFAVMALAKLYDFNEYSRTILQRPAEPGSVTLWSHDPVQSWLAFQSGSNQQPEFLQLAVTRDLAAIYVSSLTRGVPRWFAESTGYVLAARTFPKNGKVKEAQAAANQVGNQIKSLGLIRNPQTKPNQAALGGYYILAQLLNQKPKLQRLQDRLQAAETFEEGFRNTFGAAPEEVFPDK